jgi:glycosyltransferase involved in cell wall biosynthesis
MKVSVAMITYLHEHLIEEAILGVLMQECNFEVELIVADDRSPDNTKAVVDRIKETHPNGSWIKYTRHETNMGVAANFAWSMLAGNGKYVAICEGDDYWTDPQKLQKQVDFLEQNPDYTLSCHNVDQVDRNGKSIKIIERLDPQINLALVLKEGWFIRTSSILFNARVLENGFPDFFYEAYSTDYILHVLILKYGDGYYLPETMSAYRRHEGGVSQNDTKLQLERWIKKIQLLDKLDEFTAKQYSAEVSQHKFKWKKAVSFTFISNPRFLSDFGFGTYLKFVFSTSTLAYFKTKIENQIRKRF